ncbi:KTSC domain-containing protein [Anaerobacillus isosaccharinicus]|uniref:KTSC domain-containing protein n=1 Tax=Anaerobacillus isosaccharinicus TaxID=1532552 RepID=A0A1S2MDJ9_9BACI|nr:KTSC domain-containing protein [Anaerobacillus isosaccharinicus]MBA5587789.1 KTSC domain-containing protein [Anaerobacillus isosaccharinicus]QOY34054.1 KTSC domain-containing protein [Anaerobacillus isosaccharinicus]
METTNFNSPHIQSATYDDITHALYIRFTNGEYYVYYDVMPIDYIGFLSTEDHSWYVTDRLNRKYDMKRLH